MFIVTNLLCCTVIALLSHASHMIVTCIKGLPLCDVGAKYVSVLFFLCLYSLLLVPTAFIVAAMDLLAYDIERSQLPKGIDIFPGSLSHSATYKIRQAKKKASPSAPPVIDSGQLRKNCCSKWKYKIRWCSSKAAFLVLFWNLLLSFSSGSLQNLYPTIGMNRSQSIVYRNLVSLLPYVSWTIAAPLSGWVADAHLGTYRVVRIGIALLFLSTAVNCILYQITGDVIVKFDSVVFVCAVVISNTIGLIGQATILVTLLSLVLSQMPDASTANITTFIAWFVCSIQAGYWLCDVTSLVPVWCLKPFINYLRIWGFFPALCVVIVLISDFFLSPKWLIIEPKSPQSLLIIFRVFKFAWKHKSPLNRSALTYWEEDIPSRLDLGKSRYGGPFTTEEVEDIKTILRLLAVSVPLLIIMVSYYLAQDSLVILPTLDSCVQSSIMSVVINDSGAYVLGTVLYEFAVYPLISNLFEPSIFKRIGLAAFLVMILNVVYLGLSVALSISSASVWPWLRLPSPSHSWLPKGIVGHCNVRAALCAISLQNAWRGFGLLLVFKLYSLRA